jgi:hypothetical protein
MSTTALQAALAEMERLAAFKNGITSTSYGHCADLLRAALAEPEPSVRTIYDEERDRINAGGHRMLGYGDTEEACDHGRAAHTDTGCLHCGCRIMYAGGMYRG